MEPGGASPYRPMAGSGMKTLIRCLAISLLALAGSGCVPSDLLYGGGGAYGYPGQGYPDQSYPSPGYGQGGQRFRCESDGNRQRYCSVDTRGGVQMIRQLSSTPCLRGRNWDYDRNGVWVSHGCRAEFATGYGNDGGYYGGGDNYGRDVIRCESSDNRTRQCAADTRGGVRLVRQLSSSACIEGRNWGYDRNAIWVSQGCRAEFQLGGGGSSWGGGYPGGDQYGSTLRCESSDNRQRRCNVSVRDGVDLIRQLSGTRCVEGSNWGWDRAGIWVDRGCRAEFRVY